MTRIGRGGRAAAVAALIAAGACALPGSLDGPREGGPVLRVRTPQGADVRTPLEEYVLVVVLSELAPAAGDRAAAERMFDVQALVARTYAVSHRVRHAREGFDLCATSHCQLYDARRAARSSWAAAARAAVSRTAGQILWHGGTPIRAVFHADCGGFTSAAEAVWAGPPRPYLTAARDDVTGAAVHSTWQFSIRSSEMVAALNADARTRVGRHLRNVRVVERDAAGRAALVLLQGEREPLVRGEEFRGVLLNRFGARSIRSTMFEVSRQRDAFVFSGQGHGHGVGLCQAGALARLRRGATPPQVLSHYYPGTRVGKISNP